MYRESNMEIYNTVCEIDSHWEFSLWLRELEQGLCDRLKGGMGRKRTWCTYAWFLLMCDRKPQNFCKALILQLKIVFKNPCSLIFCLKLKSNIWHYSSEAIDMNFWSLKRILLSEYIFADSWSSSTVLYFWFSFYMESPSSTVLALLCPFVHSFPG